MTADAGIIEAGRGHRLLILCERAHHKMIPFPLKSLRSW